MQYREIGKERLAVAALGFGMMRLPMKDGKADVDTSVRMLRHAIDSGINYVDTAYNYLDGDSERITGFALRDGYRDRVLLATKAPVWLMNEAADLDRYLDEQLNRLETDHIDFYLLHGMNSMFWSKVEALGLLEKMKAAKASGKIRHMGFSFHDNLKVFRRIIDRGVEWDFCQIQLNYYDETYQAGIEGLRYAHARGISVVIMEPLRGGFLVNVPEKVGDVFRNTERTPVEWALDYLWDMREISVVLSGMGTIEQAEENMRYADRSSIGMFGDKERAIIQKAQENFKSFNVIPCTGCAYCLPCPKGVAIPYNISAYNQYQIHGEMERAKTDYANNVPLFGERADACIACHACEQICPQHIKISDWLPKIHKALKK